MLRKASIFHYSKNNSSLTLQTKFKVELNIGELTSLFETVRTLKKQRNHDFVWYVWVETYRLHTAKPNFAKKMKHISNAQNQIVHFYAQHQIYDSQNHGNSNFFCFSGIYEILPFKKYATLWPRALQRVPINVVHGDIADSSQKPIRLGGQIL